MIILFLATHCSYLTYHPHLIKVGTSKCIYYFSIDGYIDCARMYTFGKPHSASVYWTLVLGSVLDIADMGVNNAGLCSIGT